MSTALSPVTHKLVTGRPTKFCRELTEEICRHLGSGVPMEYAAALAGTTVTSVTTWRRKYPRFEAAVREAIGRGIQARLEIIRDAAQTDWHAASWWLEHVLPEHFAKTRIQVEAVGQFGHFTIPRETLDQIAEARAAYDRERNGGTPALLPAPPTPN